MMEPVPILPPTIVNRSDRLSKICAFCEKAFMQLIDPSNSPEIRSLEVDHQKDLNGLSESSRGGCGICSTIQEFLREFDDDAAESSFWVGHMFFPGAILSYREASHVIDVYVRFGTDGRSCLPIMSILPEQEKDGILKNVYNRKISVTPDFSTALRWINECLNHHDQCSRPQETTLPSRIIDIGISGVPEPKLIEAGHQKGAYTALSHCWGDDVRRDQMTTRENRSERLQRLPLHSMAPTYKDAVIATRSLGYQYLWIDVFCIVQDDEEDWARECGQMAGVFAKACVVLAASCASGPDDGFLHVRSSSAFDCSAIVPPETTIDVRIADHVISLLIARDLGSLSRLTLEPEEDSLITRAWIYQERALCTRILSFHRQRMLFECQYGLQCERRRRRVPHVSNIFGQLGEGFSGWLEWQEAVREVTSRSITYGNDRLPTLAGIASRYQAFTRYTFVAGLWRETLLKDMSWYTTEHGKSNAKHASNVWAPSWSWASCAGPVYFREADEMYLKPAVDILEVMVEPENDANPFGNVAMAELKLKGPIKRVRCHWESTGYVNHAKFFAEGSENTTQRCAITFIPDSCEAKSRSPKNAADAVILLLWKLNEENFGSYLALLLRPLSPTLPIYRRIGLLVIDPWQENPDDDYEGSLLSIEDALGTFEDSTVHLV